MKSNYNKKYKTEIEGDAFEELETFENFEVKLQSFIHQTDKIVKQKLNLNAEQNNQITNLDFQAIILNKIVKRSIKQKMLKPKHTEICQEFGIDYFHLMKIDNLEDKQTYVIYCATQTIEKSLENLLNKYKSDKQECQQVKQFQELDLYSWLKVKSQFKKLKKILQYALVELVGDSSNQDKIKLFFAYINQNIKKRHKTTESLTFSTAHTSRVKTQSQNPYEDKLFLTPPQYQFIPPEIFFEWNKAIELGYIKQNQNIDRIGFETMKKQNAKGINYSKREKLLDQCQEGNFITDEELKYLSSTSFLINRCVDKDFIQRAINFMDSQVIHQIEMNIAEQVLNNFYFLRKNLTLQRKKWLENINEVKRKRIKIKSMQNERKNIFFQNSGEIRNIKKKIINQLKDFAKKKQLKNQSEKKKEKYLRAQRRKGNPLANIYVQKFKEIVLQVISKIREKKITNEERQKEFLERNQAKPPPKVIFQTGETMFDITKSKRAFHPPSKVMTNLSEIKQLQASSEVKQDLIKKFRLGIRNYTITQDQFRNYYSGGPFLPRQFKSQELQKLNKSEDQDLEYPHKNDWITAQIEVQAANKIKAAMKRYLQKKALDKLIVKKEVIKNRDIEIKIRKCMQAKKFFEELHKELNKRQTERLKDISIHQPPRIPLDKIEKIASSHVLSNQKSSASLAPTFRNSKPRSQRISIAKRIQIKNEPEEIKSNLDTARRAEIEIEEIARKKKHMKFSKQKEMSEVKLKNRKLIVAAKMKNLQIALTAGFIYNQKDTNLCDRLGNTPLYYSAKNGDEQFCRFLLNLGANVNQQCENLNTPLHMAFQSESKQIIIDFINKGGNLNILNADKYTPLAFGSKELLSQLNLCHLVATTKNENLESDNNKVFTENKAKLQERDFGEMLIYDRYKHKTIY